MKYVFNIKQDSRETTQLWIEDVFDLSVVQLMGIWPSPFRGQFMAKVDVTIDNEVKKAFDSGLDRLRSIYPEEKRILLYYEEQT